MIRRRRLGMALALWAGVAQVMAQGCTSGSPRARYRAAVAQRFAGNTQAYDETLLALAADEPDSRAGRRARAVLQGSDQALMLALLAVGAAAPDPALHSLYADLRQQEAEQGLRAILRAQKDHFAQHRAYCKTFADCDLFPGPTATYVYFFSQTERAGGGGAREAAALRERAAASLAALGLVPGVADASFTIVAVGDVDDDADLDIWVVNERGNLIHVLDDGGP